MIYRRLGRTGLQVSQLGFGAMRLPMVGEGEEARVNRELAIPMIHRAIEGGVNFLDTAVGYCNEDSQRVLGEAIAGMDRARLVLSTKNPYFGDDEKAWWTNLENSLERLGTGYIDIYNHHGITWNAYTEHVEPRMAAWMRRAKDQGMIRHICCSFHDTPEALIRILETGYVSSVILQYNMLNTSLEAGIARAHELDIGVVVMGPVGGGRFGDPSKVFAGMVPGIQRVPELALKFVLSNPNVTVALSGMSTMEQVEENLRICAGEIVFGSTERAMVGEHLVRLKKMADLYCTGCGYCMPCPANVNIPVVFERYNWARIYDLWDSARIAYAGMGKSPWDKLLPADACVECGECEEKCPQKLPIREQLKTAHKALKPQD